MQAHGVKHAKTLVAIVAFLGACGGARQEAASTTTITSGPTYTPGAIELYTARQHTGTACGTQVTPTVQFAPGTDGMLPGEGERVTAWATCLNRPELAHTTVVLVGGDEPGGPEGLFISRANRLRQALIERGVAPERILVGAPSASREGGQSAATSAVVMEVTTSETLRALTPKPPITTGIGYGLR